MSTQRSHHGCWTCKRKRRRCDNARPTCDNCRQRGLVCEGYEVRLRWGSGIASRGRFTGADKPLEESIPARQRGRRRDLSRGETKPDSQAHNDAPAPPAPDSDIRIVDPQYNSVSPSWGPAGNLPANGPWNLDSQDEALFNEFRRSGINILHATSEDDSALGPRLLQLCPQSRALYAVCVAFQASLTPEIRQRFYEYFDAAIATFRAELIDSGSFLSDGTWNAGLILCTIGMMNGGLWTMHLVGMHKILLSRGLDNLHRQLTPSRKHLLEVLGVMDLPTFTVGRRTPYIGIWNRYCRGHAGGEEIERVTALPRSLLDIFSRIGLGTVEEDFWNWPGEQGDFLQCYLWEAHRLAGILTLRRSRVFPTLGEARLQDVNRGAAEMPPRLPRTEVLLTQVLANIDAIRRGSKEPVAERSLVMNAINYPLFVAGLEIGVLNSRPEWKMLIRDCYCDERRGKYGVDDRLQLKVLEEFWQRNDMTLNVNDLAREMNLELGLL